MKYRVNRTEISVAAATLFLLTGQLYANTVPTLQVQDQVVDLGSKLSFVLSPIDVDGAVPNVFIRSGPDGATLSDNADGTRTFSWRPNRKGNFEVNFVVQDGENPSLANQYRSKISVVEINAANVAVRAIGSPVTTNVAVQAIGSQVETNVAVRQLGSPVETNLPVQQIGSQVETNVAFRQLGSPVETNVEVQAISPPVEPNVEVQAISSPVEPDVVLQEISSPVEPNVEVQAISPPVAIKDDATEENVEITVEDVAVEPEISSISPVDSDQSIYLNGEAGTVSKIMTNLPVSTAQTNVQQSPIDVSGRYLYTANIEPGPNGDSKGGPLRTVLRQGYQREDNTWEWKNTIVDDRTLHDRWHSAPSVAVDKTGHIHVAYNMHNFPWQYKKSDRAHDITSMVFKGQPITDAELKLAHEQNRTRFPTLGSAAIPGNQITYPAFSKDKNDDLYVSYRFAAAPKRKFSERTMSTGIAVYDTNSRTWSSIGAKHNPSDGDFDADAASPNAAMPFAGKKGWTSYLPKVVFSKQNNMIVRMFWRSGEAGRQVTMPCVVRGISRNDVVDMKGGSMSLPVQPEQCGNIGISNSKSFYSIGSFAIDNEDNPHLLLSPTEGPRFITRYSAAQQRWIEEEAPEGATEIFFDNDNNMYAISSGIKIFMRTGVDADWQTIYSDKSANNCYPKVKMDASGKNAFVHAQSCDEKHITIYGLRLP